MKQKTKKISWENFKDEIKVISAAKVTHRRWMCLLHL